MSLVGRVGRNRLRARFATFVLYVLLSLGAVSMIYPFLLMLATGFKGPTDQNDNRLIPAFWSDHKEMLTKYLEDKYSGSTSFISATRTGPSAPIDVMQAYRSFLASLPNEFWLAGFRTPPNAVTGKLTMRYQSWLRTRFRDIGELNRAYIEENVAFQGVSPPSELLDRRNWKPLPGQKQDDWQIFKRTLPPEFRLPILKRRLFQEFLRSRTENQIDRLPTEVRRGAADYEHVPIIENGHLWRDFVENSLPARFTTLAAEDLWQRRSSEPMPIEAEERNHVLAHASELSAEFSSRNYRYVLDYILINGRALWNTALFCLLAVLTQLIINPLAAYALSRYPMPSVGKVLIFLLATMAFPAEVALIPSFLLLKDLGLLNTFAALVLPSAASGYMIFLLKGFFDSLPQELYESGQIDGAKETTMLWKIALPLSRPVLGYLALLAFMGAYGAFMYAFLVAQDQKMWTLTVWIYQLQLYAPKAVVMAALTLAAIPTILVFLLSQKVIMRGIVLPGER